MSKVIGIGDNVVDRYAHTRLMYPGGNALNFSVYAKQLGKEAAYLGVLGTDEAASHITRVLTEIGVDISRCRYYEGENGYAKIDLVDGDRVFVGSNKGGVAKKHPIALGEADLEYIKGFDLVHTSCHSYIEEEISKIEALGIPLSFDFSSEWDEQYLKKICPYVTFSFLSCGHLEDDAIREILKKIHAFGSKLALATMGSRGAMLYDGKNIYTQKPNKVVAKDTLGAGDSFVTAFLLRYMEGHDNNNQNTFEEQLIKDGLAEGALFASKTCRVDGAFGYGIPYNR